MGGPFFKKMVNMAENIVKMFLAQAEDNLKKNSDECFIFLKRNLIAFQEHQNVLPVRTPAKDSKSEGWLNYHIKLKEHLHVLHDWLESEETDVDFLFADRPWRNLQEQHYGLRANFEERCNLPYEEIALEVSPTDSWIRRLRKKLTFARYELKSRQSVRMASQKGMEEQGRSFNIHEFVEHFITIPAAAFMLSRWQKTLALFSKILVELHQASEVVEDHVLLAAALNNQETSYWDALKAHTPLEGIKVYIDESNRSLNRVDQVERESEKRDRLFIDELDKQVNGALRISGSHLLPGRSFNQKKIHKNWKRLDHEFLKAKKKWQEHLQGSKEEWHKDLELSALQLSALEMHEETRQFIGNKFRNKLIPVFDEIENDINNSLILFKKEDEIKKDELRKELLVENRTLVKVLRQEKLPKLMDAITQANFPQTFQGFFRRIEDEIKELTDSHIIFTERDMEHSPPDSKMVEIPLKELVADEIFSRAQQPYRELDRGFSRAMETVIRRISSLDQIVEFNLEAANNLLKERSDDEAVAEARDIAVSGLERTSSNLEDLKDEVTGIIDKYSALFSDIVLEFEQELQKLADSRKILELKLRVARARTRDRLIENRDRIWQKMKSFFPAIVRATLESTRKIKSGIFQFRRAAGLAQHEKVSGDQITRFLIETYQKVKKMPYIYQRLFRLDPLEEKRFFYGRNAAIDSMREDFDSFKQGYQALTAIVGEKGNGKTTVLNFCEQEIFSGYQITKLDCNHVVYQQSEFLNLLKDGFGFPEVQTIEELEDRLKNLTAKKICIFENIHTLFLRVIDGFEVMERFLLLISNTRSNIFWIVTSGLYAWEYMDRVLNISDFFKRTLLLDRLSASEIKDIILTRHRVSGYDLHFEETQRALSSRQYKRLTGDNEKQEFLNDRFFEELAEISGGNIKSSLILWLSVLKDFDEDKIHVGSRIELDYSALFQLSSEEYFTLAALIQHEYLNYDQHALIFNHELDASRSVLGRLYKKGFLERKEDRYSVHPLLYRPVVKVLKSKNILY